MCILLLLVIKDISLQCEEFDALHIFSDVMSRINVFFIVDSN